MNAPRAMVYCALLDARAVATWMVPTGMTTHVHNGLPPGLSTAAHEVGWRMSLAKLAAFVGAGASKND